MRNVSIAGLLVLLWFSVLQSSGSEPAPDAHRRLVLQDNWRVSSSYQVAQEGDQISTEAFVPKGWYAARVPGTVLRTLIDHRVYPDVRIGLNSFRIPDASDEFNAKHDLTKFSHLPGQRNPWKDPYWYRTEFTAPAAAKGQRAWLCFDAIHYRADVWLNGQRIADAKQVVGTFARYRFDVTAQLRPDRKNCLAVKFHLLDHPGTPQTQLEVFGKDRKFHTEAMKDVGLPMTLGYDCMGTVPDRNTGPWQQVYLEFRGPVAIRDPFVVPRLPLPKTCPATLRVSAVLENSTPSRQEGWLTGRIEETGGTFLTRVALGPSETRKVVFEPEQHTALRIENPRLWWPRNYGPQNLYHMVLKFEADGQVSDQQPVTFGIRQVTKELHQLDGAHGLRVLVNGQKIFCRGGYIQPELLFDWDARRMEAEIRYLAEANINLVYFEDIPSPPDVFLDLCDQYGVMFGNCFYGCYWMQPGTDHPQDLDLLARGTIDIIRRHRNHPSLVLYMAMNEGETREEVYRPWRRAIQEEDGTRLSLPSGSFPDYRKKVPEWIKPDLPAGANDYPPKSYGWSEPAQFYRWVRENRNWMFMLESGCPTLPPYDSLRRFLPDLEQAPSGPFYPLSPAWAHHDACHYFKPYDAALRRLYGQPKSVLDYLAKSVLLSAEQHRAMYEAANHRMWDITSGFSQWKLNAAWPSVEWQIYDWSLRPLVTYYYIKKACEPLHVQLSALDRTVTVVNHLLQPQERLEARAGVYDIDGHCAWKKSTTIDMPANCYRDVVAIPDDVKPAPIYFVRLELRDSRGGPISDNFYWHASQDGADLAALDRMSSVRLTATFQIRRLGQTGGARVRVENRTDRPALMVQLALTKGRGGDEILPVYWEDNYFSLLPGEVKEVSAQFALADLGSAEAILEVGGWNVETDYRCQNLAASTTAPRSGKPIAIKAAIADTFLQGSRIVLRMDDRPMDSRWIWARGGQTGQAAFEVQFPKPGTYRLSVGGKTLSLTAE